ncbi:S8 family serine peptidase [Pyrococcus kukulkanii]|uniref:S8 family serine peptidase n=1 Tax=Pyrococcus kukulkanii TaxID=1609559 RepID=UPI00356A10EF
MRAKMLVYAIIILLVLSAIPIVPTTAETTSLNTLVTFGVKKLNVNTKEPEPWVPPLDKIEPELLKELKNASTGLNFVLAKVVSTDEISKELKKIGLDVLGKSKIAGAYVYIVKLPRKENTEKKLLKAASLKQVMFIARTNPVKPIETYSEPSEESLKKIQVPKSKYSYRVDQWKEEVTNREIKGMRVALSSEIVPERLKPKSASELKIQVPEITMPEPNDVFAVSHHKATKVWDLGITGEGIYVAVIDSGIDFGNPDLQDAYAVDTNPNSPYYGWPIAYDGNSMLAYLLFNLTFPEYLFSWYTNVSVRLTPVPFYGSVGIGYKGNYTVVFTTMSMANIVSAKDRAEIMAEIFKWIGNVSKVLLVDDDGGDVFEVFYEEALKELDMNYTIIHCNETKVELSNLTGYDVVLWFTGGAYDTISEDDVKLWEEYLNNGGKLWLSSVDYLYQQGFNNFTLNYLHVVNAIEDLPAPSIVVTYEGTKYRVGEVGDGAFVSPTDVYVDYIVPDGNATILLTGYLALAHDLNRNVTYIDIKLPLTENLTVPTKSGVIRLGLHPDLALWFDWAGGYVLLTDPNESEKYDTIYVDLLPSTVIDFNKDTGHTKDNPVIQLDFWDAFKGWFGSDGYADLSGGLLYFIADGKTPIPYSNITAARWGFPLRIPESGELVAFMIGTVYTAGGDHGTLCAAAVAARGRTYYGDEYLANTYGTAIGAKIIAEGSLYQGGIWEDYLFFAVEGYDGVPATGDEALVVSNSYGNSYVINKGYRYADRFLYYLTHYYTPWVTFLFAAGNGGPGYGTVTSSGASPGVITVGAAVEFGYRNLYGYDEGPLGFSKANYGDVAPFSNRGPNALGQVDPDVLAVGMFAAGSLPVNSIGNGVIASDLWSGTSLATPMAAGITALVYQAFYEAHGRWPTFEEVRTILMNTADDVSHDVFSQGAGFLNAYRAVKLALDEDGLFVYPPMWQAGETQYPAFANVMYPGETVEKTFMITNVNKTSDKNVTISAEVFEKIGEYVFEVNSSMLGEMIRIDQYMPNDTELLKVTVYTPYEYFISGPGFLYAELFAWTDVNGNGTVEVPDEVNRLQADVRAGTSLALTLGDPWSKFTDGLLFRLRFGGGVNYVKLEFYKRVPWSWVEVPSNVVVPANGTTTFTATLTVPENASLGIYEGAIYLDYNGTRTTIPVSVVVASKEPKFTFGGKTNATGLYDNSNIYGYFDWWWRYETGDWRLLYFNVSDNISTEDKYIVVDLNWTGTYPTDINLHVIGPEVDDWSLIAPSVFGPYTLVEYARSDDGYIDAGQFVFKTTSGEMREVISSKISNGLHAIWLHNVLFDGNSSYRTFSGRVSIVRVWPKDITEITNNLTGKFNVDFEREYDFGTLTTLTYGLIVPTRYIHQLAPLRGESKYYIVNVTNSGQLDVVLTSIYDDLAGLDLDLYVYYYVNGQMTLMGSSGSPTADERVTINFPYPGTYIIEVYSYDNPAPGETYYDLYIYNYEAKNNLWANTTEYEENKYNITLSYDLRAEENRDYLEATITGFLGKLFIGSPASPTLIQVPIKIIPSNETLTDIYVYAMNISPELIEVGGTANISFIIINMGQRPGYTTKVSLLDGKGNVLAQSVIPVFEPGAVYEAYFVVEINNPDLEYYKLVVTATNDGFPENNEMTFGIRGVSPDFLMNEGNVDVQYVYPREDELSGYGEVARVDPEVTDEGGTYGVSLNLRGIGTVVMVLPEAAEDIKVTDFHEITMLTDIVFNPFDDRALGKKNATSYVITVNGTPKFNPFAIPEVRRAIQKLIDRDYVINEIFNSTALPLYGAISSWSKLYEQFLNVYEVAGVMEYNEKEALKEINEALEKASVELARYNYTLEKINGTWYFNGEPVTIVGIGVSEDERKDIAEYVAKLLEEAGFKVELEVVDRRTASAMVYTNVDNATTDFKWAFYTEGWVPSFTTESNLDVRTVQYYTPLWFYPGFTPLYPTNLTVKDAIESLGGYNETIEKLRLYYYNTPEKLMEIENMTLEELGRMLLNGIEDTNQLLDLSKLAMYLGYMDGLRVFLALDYNNDNSTLLGYKVIDYEGKKLLLIHFNGTGGVRFTVSYKIHREQYEEEAIEGVEQVEETIDKVVETAQEVLEKLENITTGTESVEELFETLENISEENPEVIEEIAEQLNMSPEEVHDLIEDTHVEEVEGGTALMMIASEINGNAKIVKNETEVQVTAKKEGVEDVKKATAEIVVDGDHGMVVTVAIKLPLDIQEYEVNVKDADLLRTQLIKKERYSLLLVTLRLHSPAEITVEAYEVKKPPMVLVYSYYYVVGYKILSQDFEKYYNIAQEAGVSSEVLQEAMELKKVAEENYKKAVELGILVNYGNPYAFPYIREAYINLLKAIDILKNALES